MSEDSYSHQGLAIIVIGASGDLAQKKTFPALFELFKHGRIPKHVYIIGFARSLKSDEMFRDFLRSYLQGNPMVLEEFVAASHWVNGAYDSLQSFSVLNDKLIALLSKDHHDVENRLFYFATPPDVFILLGICIKAVAMSTTGWNRIIIEKPFGRDLSSAVAMSSQLREIFNEDQIYRIDHYLAKEMVQNLLMFRFGNSFLEPLLNKTFVKSVRITFKENFGTLGRGGYFDNYGIIRDVMQNHLMQVLSIVAMDAPVKIEGEGSSEYVRDAKVKVLRSIQTPDLSDVILGQYVGNDNGDIAYLDDPTVPAGSTTPTFAQAVFYVNTPRWAGVPFIMKAGKALDERKAEVRIRFKTPPAASFLFDGKQFRENELVLRLQPSEAIYLKVNVKTPGLSTEPLSGELDLSYSDRFEGIFNPDAYTRLILECLKGSQTLFVRSDELEASWKILDPLLDATKHAPRADDTSIDSVEGRASSRHDGLPVIYSYVHGSRGPDAADSKLNEMGIDKDESYHWVKL